MRKPNQHVVPRETGWAVMPENGKRASALFNTKDEALRRAREIANNYDSEVVVHKRDAKIQDVHSPRLTTNTRTSSTGIAPVQHVVPHKNGWAVTSEGNTRADVVRDTKYAAIREAHKRADKLGAAMVVHGKDGSFQKIDNPPHFPSPVSALLHV